VSRASRTLLVAPYLGEFGWELMNWQGRVRWLAQYGGYERIIVCATPDKHLLYHYPENETQVLFLPVPRLDVAGQANEDHRVDNDRREMGESVLLDIARQIATRAAEHAGIESAEIELLTPDFRGTLWPTTGSHQLFNSLRMSSQPIDCDVLLVPRLRSAAAERNQSAAWWDELTTRLESRGLRVTRYAPRVDEAVRQISGARLAAGASTGGLHLASLCGCPHLVWGADESQRWTKLGMTNRQRYETFWNPLGTACRYEPCGWNPTAQHAAENICRALDEIGLQGSPSSWAWSLKPTWRIKRHLASLVQPGRLSAPWRVRQLVMHKLV
jgi:hypothetical protein